MKLIGLEEHFVTREGAGCLAGARRAFPGRGAAALRPRRDREKLLEAADLSDINREAIAHGNWEGLVSGIRRG
jgi:hypothetical protein